MFVSDCRFFSLPNSETALQLQEALEAPAAYGPGNVAVTEEPASSRRFLVESIGEDAGKAVPSLSALGASAKVLSGGSGRLVLTLTNLGNAAVDGSSVPVKITDELPEGVVALGVEAFAGVDDLSGPVDCSVESNSLVSCTFEGTLPPYEAIEVEIPASLTGDPPVAGAPGKVSVSGGNAKAATAVQAIKVSPEPTPFGIDYFSAQAEEEGGDPAIQAGGHPFQLTTTFQLNTNALDLGATRKGTSIQQPALPRNLRFPLPAGLVGNATVAPRCEMADFFDLPKKGCQPQTAIGVASVTIIERGKLGLTRIAVPVFNLPPAPGEPARFGFVIKGAPVLIDTALDPEDKYRITAEVRNVTQLADTLASTVTLWGTPGDPQARPIARLGVHESLSKAKNCRPASARTASAKQPSCASRSPARRRSASACGSNRGTPHSAVCSTKPPLTAARCTAAIRSPSTPRLPPRRPANWPRPQAASASTSACPTRDC